MIGKIQKIPFTHAMRLYGYSVYKDVVIFFAHRSMEQKQVHVYWAIEYAGKLYGDYVKLASKTEVTEAEVNEAVQVLWDQAIRSIDGIIKQ